MAVVQQDWFWFECGLDAFTGGWKGFKALLLNELGFKIVADIDRCVYMFRILAPFAVAHPKGASPVLYIGEGTFQQRVTARFQSVARTFETIQGCRFEVGVVAPRVRNNIMVHEQVEAYLIQRHVSIYGSRPLLNRQTPRKAGNHSYPKGFTRKLRRGQGTRYRFALTPLKTNFAFLHAAKG